MSRRGIFRSVPKSLGEVVRVRFNWPDRTAKNVECQGGYKWLSSVVRIYIALYHVSIGDSRSQRIALGHLQTETSASMTYIAHAKSAKDKAMNLRNRENTPLNL